LSPFGQTPLVANIVKEVGHKLRKERGKQHFSSLMWWHSEAVERRRWRCGSAVRAGDWQVTFVEVRGLLGGQKLSHPGFEKMKSEPLYMRPG
jgi:hypothetical protein